MNVFLYVFYAFLNYLTDFDEISYRDKLDPGKIHRLPFVAKKWKVHLICPDQAIGILFNVI
jgi:hypothetical protein